MARPTISQPMPGINEPLAIIEHQALGRIEIFPTEAYRKSWESENQALFADGASDVTQGIDPGGVILGAGTSGDYVESISQGANVSVTGGTGEGSTPTVALVAAPVVTGFTCNGNIVLTGSIDGRDPSVDGTKLDGVATGATANDTDANLKARANHTGTQAISTIVNLQTTLDAKVSKTTGITDASIAHALNATFDDTEVEAALDALGAKVNEIIDALNA